MDGVDQLICCSVEGEVRGYKPMTSHVLNVTSDRNINQEAIRDMAQRKQVKIYEIHRRAVYLLVNLIFIVPRICLWNLVI